MQGEWDRNIGLTFQDNKGGRPPVADRPGAAPGEQSGQSLPEQLLVDQSVTNLEESHRPPVALYRRRLDFDPLAVPGGGSRQPQQRGECHEPRKS